MRFVHIKKSLTRARDRIMLGLLGVALLTGVVKAAPGSELLSAWEASVETNAESIDHSAWQGILDTYLTSHPSGINRFDYAALKADAEDAAKLAGYLTSLQELDPRHYSRQEQQPTGSTSTTRSPCGSWWTPIRWTLSATFTRAGCRSVPGTTCTPRSPACR